MTGKLFLVFLLIAVLFSLLGGCDSSKHPTLSHIITTATTTVTPTIPPPTFTPSRTPTLTFIPSLTSTLTFTPVATLAPDNAYAHLREILTDTTNCRLPCWLGITPGKSTLADVLALVQSFKGVDSKSDYLDTITGNETYAMVEIPYPNDNATIEIDPSYLMRTDEDKVSIAFVDTRADWYINGQWGGYAYGYYAYNQLLKHYTLSGILSEYGLPTHIYIFGSLRADIILSVSQTPFATDLFRIHLVYPDQGILMKYEMPVEGRGDNYRFCPSKAQITGYLMPSGSAEDFYTTLHSFEDDGGFYKSYPPDAVYSKTPEGAFGMTIQELYQSFQSAPDHCLETLKSIWWPEDLWNELSKNP
jgi:hypothetical protein